MTEKELLEIKGLEQEIELLRRQRDIAVNKAKVGYTFDSVTGSSKSIPFAPHCIRIEGLGMVEGSDAVLQAQRALEKRIDILMAKVEDANAYIAGLPDCQTRMVLQARFINGLTWEQIEGDLGIPQTTAKRKYRKWRDAS